MRFLLRTPRAACAPLLLLLGLGPGTARAEELEKVFPLSGDRVVPPSTSKATATAIVILKGRTGKLEIHWEGLSGKPSRFEIRGPALAGQSGDLLFSLPVPKHLHAHADSAEVSFSVAQTRKKLFRDEQTYLSVKTPHYPRGEIRGQIIPTDEENDEDD
jgi:CHRD domain-containing protein